MGATKHVLRRLAGTTVRLEVGSVQTITGRLPTLALLPDGEDSVLGDLATALGVPETGRFHPDDPPPFARTVKPRFVVQPGPAGELTLRHAKRGTVLAWPVDARVLREVTAGGQALLVLAPSEPQDDRPVAEHLLRVPAHLGWIDVLREASPDA